MWQQCPTIADASLFSTWAPRPSRDRGALGFYQMFAAINQGFHQSLRALNYVIRFEHADNALIQFDLNRRVADAEPLV